MPAFPSFHTWPTPLTLASLPVLLNYHFFIQVADHSPQLQLINDHGMEVYPKFFTKLVCTCAPQIFPGLSRPTGSTANGGHYTLLQGEMEKIGRDPDQATKISESIETGSEDIFKDFDLSTFMEHFRLNALEKTILALAFKMGNRPDLKTKGMLARAAFIAMLLHYVAYGFESAFY